MRILIGVFLSLVIAAPGADAAIFGLFGTHKGRRCLPRAIDSPVLRPKVKDRHKEGKRGGDHPKKCLLIAPSGSGTGTFTA
jgi:hypothetical protein